jgi:4-amino-4-deoxy-L-arabinose transferase-like glycosyltransferase
MLRHLPMSASWSEKLPIPERLAAAASCTGTSRARWHVPLLLALCGALYLSGLASRPLWDTDEGMHAATARAMVESGDWLTPRFNGRPFYDKPVLFTWLVAGSFWLLGFSELAARLPAALLGIAGVVLTYRLGRRMRDAEVGLLAALILATSLQYVVLSITVVHDIALAWAVLLSLLGFWGCVDARGNTTRNAGLFWLGAALGVLAKGPVGLLPILLATLFIAITGRRHLVKALRIGSGSVVFALIALPWYLAMAWTHPDYARSFLLERVLESFSASSTHHVRSLFYYVPVLLGALLPWSAYLPLALRSGVRAGFADRDASALLLVLWLGATFAIFTLASSKLASYLLPLLPAAALLIASVWQDALRSGTAPRSLWIPKLLLVAGMWVLATMLHVRGAGRWLAGDLTLADTLRLAGVIAAGQSVAAGLLIASRLRAAFVAEVASFAAVLLVFTFSTAPTLASHRSSKELAARLEHWLAPGEPVAFFGRIVGIGDAALFYSGRRGFVLREARDLRAYLRAREPVVCVLAEAHLSRVSGIDFHVVERAGTRLIISNVPAP